MNFYDCEAVICQEAGMYFERVLCNKGINPDSILKEYARLLPIGMDRYSRALLVEGLKAELEVFDNRPAMSFSYIVRDNMTELFRVLGLAATQQQAYILSGRVIKQGWNRSLTPAQHNALIEQFHPKEFVALSEWCMKALVALGKLHEAQSRVAAVTEEEREFANSLNFDWYYSYSDDINVYRAGVEAHRRVARETTLTLKLKPRLEKVLYKVAEASKLSSSFFMDASL